MTNLENYLKNLETIQDLGDRLIGAGYLENESYILSYDSNRGIQVWVYQHSSTEDARQNAEYLRYFGYLILNKPLKPKPQIHVADVPDNIVSGLKKVAKFSD